ncbi:MAG: hypothetical protein GEU98_10040 [Pseudonocardiaceae bacterium]|nr:hypothetical protein [Pseudonocardiaceae bacterium]
MSARGSPSSRQSGLYARELRLSIRNNSGAYGYSVMVTSALAMLTALHAAPEAGQLFLFASGAVASFAIVEIIATRAFTRALDGEEASKVVALGSSLSLVSILLAVGTVAGCGLVLPETLGWFAGSFLGSVVYLLMTAAEMAVARRIEEARDLE